MARQVQLPVGRFVWGSLNQAQPKRDDNKQVVMKDGQPVMQYSFGMAIPNQQFGPVWQEMQAEAATLFQQIPPKFSWKVKSGDGVDHAGKPYALREGHAQHQIIAINTEFAPPVFKWDGSKYVQMQPNEYKRGDYFVMTVNLIANKPQNVTHTPGLFVNPMALLWVGYGTEIVGAAANPDELFGAVPPQFQLPPGASTTPLAPSNMPGMPGTGNMPPAGPQPGYGAPPNGPGNYAPQPGPGGYGAPQGGPAPGQPQQGYTAPTSGPQPGYGAPPNGPGNYAPAHDFVHNAGNQPQQQYGQPPQGMPPAGPQPGYGAPPNGPGNYAPQPGPGGYQPPR